MGDRPTLKRERRGLNMIADLDFNEEGKEGEGGREGGEPGTTMKRRRLLNDDYENVVVGERQLLPPLPKALPSAADPGDFALRPALGQFFSHLVDHSLLLTPHTLVLLNSVERG